MNEQPSEGGSYMRNADGSLTKVIETDEKTVEPNVDVETEKTEAQAGTSTRKVK